MPHPAALCKVGLRFGRKQEGDVEPVRQAIASAAPCRPGARGRPARPDMPGIRGRPGPIRRPARAVRSGPPQKPHASSPSPVPELP